MQRTLWADRPDAKRTKHHHTVLQVLRSYSQLVKPKIISLLLVTTAGGMWLAAEGQPVDPLVFWVTLAGGAMAAAAANVINMIYDRDIDDVMERTRQRPLPSGRIQTRDALVFAIGLAIGSFGVLACFTNLLAACLAMSGIAVYVGIYTHWLKRSSTQNIVIGGSAGAIPPLVGWAAVSGSLSWAAWVLFAIIFLWTPPHFWALAILKRDDYQKAGVPMLPVVRGEHHTSRQIFLYTLVILPITLLLVFPFHLMGAFYLTSAAMLGGGFVIRAWQLMQQPTDRDQAGGLFVYANLYLLLLCTAMGLDSLPWMHQLTLGLSDQLHGWVGTVVALL